MAVKWNVAETDRRFRQATSQKTTVYIDVAAKNSNFT